jgi:hypothetical protein
MQHGNTELRWYDAIAANGVISWFCFKALLGKTCKPST